MTPEERKEERRLYAIEYRKKNAELIKERRKESDKKYTEKTKEQKRLYDKEYREKNKGQKKLTDKKWAENNKQRINDNANKRYKTDLMFKFKSIVRSLVKSPLRNKGIGDISKSEAILGCSFEFFKDYIESKFEHWMNWDNHGNWNGQPIEINQAWDIDHIIPLCTATNLDELIKLSHYTNLQPLCSFTNRWIKRNHH